MIKKIIFSCLTFLLFVQISYAIGTTSTMEKIMNSWVGENINSVISVWGYPTSEKNIAGRKLYCWTQSDYRSSYINGTGYGGEYTCERILEADQNETVIKWQWNGNNCPGTYIRGKSWVNPNNNPWIKK